MTAASASGRASNGGYDIAYEVFGDPADPVVLLVAGLGSQMLGFRPAFCQRFVDAGFCAVRYDSRDVGLSTKTVGSPPPIAEIRPLLLAGEQVDIPYSIRDMASDGMAVLDAMDVPAAHVWGMSMGGMIVQTMAIEFANRLLSMTSVMSTTGDPAVGRPSPEAARLLVAERPSDLAAAIEMDVEERRVSAGAYFDEAEIRAYVRAQYERCNHPDGMAFQYLAVAADGDRTERLGAVAVPSSVIHGAMDPLVTLSGGEATAAAIDGAELLVVPTMGHDIPAELWDTYVEALVALAARAA